MPDDAYYGIQTCRAQANFPASGLKPDPLLVRAYLFVKKASALANAELGALPPDKSGFITRACDEVLAGRLADQFVVDPFQAGAGTSFNMNVNEVVTNRALELAGRSRGEYSSLSPNDDVNRSQSSNDTFPTASHIAAVLAADRLRPELSALASTLRHKAQELSGIRKAGRTHLMDALPLTLGDEFGAYASAVERAAERLRQRRDDLLEVAIGGTAVGTGANAPAGFRPAVVRHLAALTGLALVPARDSFEALQSRSQLAALSSALRELALELGRIASDLRLLNSGPTAGLAEVSLPPVQPGSSIMPGKVNPSLAECLNMVCFQVIACDTAVALGAGAGQLDLNVFAPVMIHNVLVACGLLSSFLPVFTERCVRGITANEPRCHGSLELNPALATLLAPRIGHLAAAELARESLERGIPVRRLVVDKKILTETEARNLFGPAGRS